MAEPVSVRINATEFTETLNRYQQLSSRDPKRICDTKAFFIARRAVLETPKADKGRITGDLGRVIMRKKEAVGMSLRTVKRFSRWGLERPAPLVALIINKRRGPGRGLYGAAMTDAIRALLAARVRSIAFLKSGWLPAIRELMGLADMAGAPRQERGPVQIGAPKGYAVPSPRTVKARTVIANTASTRRDMKGALRQFGEPALQRAFDAETRSMLDYMERKLRRTAQAAGVRTN